MKLLLTSSGLTNNSIVNALTELTQKFPEETNIVFIPTASNVELGNKDWLIDDLINLKKQKFKSIEIADISAVGVDIWKPILERSDVLYFEGGNSYHLMRWLNKSGLFKLLPDLLKSKVYVGASAGSMVASPDLSLKLSQAIYEEDLLENKELEGLNFIDFYFLPHLNSEFFKKARKENIEKIEKELGRSIYALEDNSALKVIDKNIQVVSEGDWFMIEK